MKELPPQYFKTLEALYLPLEIDGKNLNLKFPTIWLWSKSSFFLKYIYDR